MTNYAVGYTTGGAEPEKDAEGEEYVPEHAVPIVDGVTVTDQVPAELGLDRPEVEDGDDEGKPRCGELKANGEPCKNAPGDDGLCGVHRKQKEANGDDGTVAASAPAAGPAAGADAATVPSSPFASFCLRWTPHRPSSPGAFLHGSPLALSSPHRGLPSSSPSSTSGRSRPSSAGTWSVTVTPSTIGTACSGTYSSPSASFSGSAPPVV